MELIQLILRERFVEEEVLEDAYKCLMDSSGISSNEESKVAREYISFFGTGARNAFARPDRD